MITRPRKTEQTGHVLETEIVAGVFPPVAEDNTEYRIESYSALKVMSHESSKLKNKSILEYGHQILDDNKIEPPCT